MGWRSTKVSSQLTMEGLTARVMAVSILCCESTRWVGGRSRIWGILGNAWEDLNVGYGVVIEGDCRSGYTLRACGGATG